MRRLTTSEEVALRAELLRLIRQHGLRDDERPSLEALRRGLAIGAEFGLGRGETLRELTMCGVYLHATGELALRATERPDDA